MAAAFTKEEFAVVDPTATAVVLTTVVPIVKLIGVSDEVFVELAKTT